MAVRGKCARSQCGHRAPWLCPMIKSFLIRLMVLVQLFHDRFKKGVALIQESTVHVTVKCLSTYIEGNQIGFEVEISDSFSWLVNYHTALVASKLCSH